MDLNERAMCDFRMRPNGIRGSSFNRDNARPIATPFRFSMLRQKPLINSLARKAGWASIVSPTTAVSVWRFFDSQVSYASDNIDHLFG
jgi:hypothetical protein